MAHMPPVTHQSLTSRRRPVLGMTARIAAMTGRPLRGMDRLDEVGSALDAARRASQERRSTVRRVPAFAPVLPQALGPRIGEEAPPSVSAGQDPFVDLYPRPDSNRRYRRERAAC